MNEHETPPGQDRPVQIELDGATVTAPTRKLNGLQIRQLGNPTRVEGFETQEIDKHGKKVRTIPDDKEIELHEGDRFRTVPNQGGPGSAVPDRLRDAVAELSKESGEAFSVSDAPVSGTDMYLVWKSDHPLPARYTRPTATIGFRVPGNFPDAGPEDSFFLWPADIKLTTPDPVRNSVDLNRAGSDSNIANGILQGPVLTFSWHLWNNKPWDRQKHKLADHYNHVLRRLDIPEHD